MNKTCWSLLTLTRRCPKHTNSHIHQRNVMRIDKLVSYEMRYIQKTFNHSLIRFWEQKGKLLLVAHFFSGSLTKKSKNRGVHIEELKLAPIVDFASGMCSQNN